MKVICTRKNLNRALSNSTRIISTGTTLPILSNILLKTESGRLRLSTTNLEIAINYWIGGKIEEQGEITVPAKIFNDLVGNLSTEKISLSTKNLTLFVEGEKTQTHIKGMGAEEFPLIPKIGETIYTKIGGETLQSAVREVVFATSFSETQPEISGVLFAFGEKTLTLAATDRYRLAERSMDLLEEAKTERRLIAPARAAVEIGRILGAGVVDIFLSENQIGFRTTEVEIISRLIEGQYPDYKQIIPKNFTSEAEIEREKMIQALRAASLFAEENNNVELDLVPQTKQVTIKAQSAQVGDSELWVEGGLVGDKTAIMFNYRYLLECLNNLADEKIVLKVINGASPAAIVPAGRTDYLYIVMPIKI